MNFPGTSTQMSRRVMTVVGALMLFSAASLNGIHAAAQTKKSAPAPKSAPSPKAAPSKPAATSTSHSTAGASGAKSSTGAAGSKAGAGSASKTGGAGASGNKTATGGSKSPVGTTKSTPGGGKVTETKKGTVTKSASGKVQSVKLNNGHEAKFGSNGKVKEVHAEAKGGGKLTVSHAGNVRRTVVERPNHTRLVSEGHGRGYIEHRYEYGGHAYYARGYYYNGGYYQNYYHPYYYGGVQLYGYAPSYYYPTAYYGWAYNPWPAPAPYAWGWGASPWYGYYGAYFAPYPVYPSPAFWLTDYLISATLSAAFQAAAADANLQFPDTMPDAMTAPHLVLASFSPGRGGAWEAALAGGGDVALSTEIKKQISDEIQLDLAAQKAQNASGDGPSVGSLGKLLADGKPHIFVAGDSISATTGSDDCTISDGDVLSLTTAPGKDAENANLSVLASKKTDCAKGNTVAVPLTDLQEMQNHLLASIDKGLGEMKDNPGKGGIPAPPADATAGSKEAPYAAAAPPRDPDGAKQLEDTGKEGVDTEKQVVAEATAADDSGDAATADTGSAGTAAGTAVARPPTMVTITKGQTPQEVIAMKGQPKQVLNFPTKQIYVYADMKITFVKGKLTDAE